MTPHIEANLEDIAKIVIMPGDPLRAEYIANKYLTNPRLVNKVRNCYAFTGYYNDTLVTVMASGMGIPSMGIYSYELYKFYDVDYIIRVGTAGSYIKEMNLYDTLLVDGVYSESTYAKIAYNYDSNTINSSNKLNDAIKKAAADKSIDLKIGNAHSSDVFYGNADIADLVNNHNCVAGEMESFALFNNALNLNKEATTLLTISNNLITKEETSSEERQTKFDDMIKLALESIKYL